MRRLMKYPPVEDVTTLILRAQTMRNLPNEPIFGLNPAPAPAFPPPGVSPPAPAMAPPAPAPAMPVPAVAAPAPAVAANPFTARSFGAPPPPPTSAYTGRGPPPPTLPGSMQAAIPGWMQKTAQAALQAGQQGAAQAAAFAGEAATKLKQEAATLQSQYVAGAGPPAPAPGSPVGGASHALFGGGGSPASSAQVRAMESQLTTLKGQNQQLGARLASLCTTLETDLLERAFAAMDMEAQQSVNKNNIQEAMLGLKQVSEILLGRQAFPAAAAAPIPPPSMPAPAPAGQLPPGVAMPPPQ